MLARCTHALASVALVAVASASARAQGFEDSLVDPLEVRSPDGAWSVFVDPSSPGGDGSAQYRLSRGAEVVWAGELACTLRDVQVGDNGVFAGASRTRAGLRLMLVDVDGKARFDTTLPPEDAVMHGPNYPISNGVVLVRDHDRVVFRVQHQRDNDHYEGWHFVRTSNGDELPTVRPVPPNEEARGLCRLGAMKPITGASPLFACTWCEFSPNGSARDTTSGTLFVVLDHRGEALWQLELAHDLEAGDDSAARSRLWRWAVRGGGLLDCATPRQFEAVFAADAQRVTFTLSADDETPSGWSVRESARADYVLPVEEPRSDDKPAEYPKLALEFLGAIELQAGAPPRSATFGFDIDDRGRFGRVIASKGVASRFELRDAQGLVIADIPLQLEPNAERSAPGIAWLRGDRWLVHAKTWGKEARCFAWWFDLPAGTLTEIPDFDCAPIEQVDGTFDGGFVALTAEHMEYTIETTLSSFDAEGGLRWRKSVAYGQSDDGLFSPEDVRVSPKGEIGVLDNIKHEIQRFDLEGKLVSAIELDKTLGREANYPTELGVDRDGNWVVYDFSGTPPVLRVSREGALTSTLTPHFGDGSTFRLPDGVHVAPDGRLWATDGYALLRLDDTGLVDHVAGDAPDTASLGEIELALVDQLGRTLLVDRRTHAAHVFDREGKRLAVCKLAPEDVTEDTRIGSLAVSSDGGIHVGLGNIRVGAHRSFSPQGELLGSAEFVGQVLFQPGKPHRWEISYSELRLCGADAAETKRILRNPDNRWMSANHAGGVAPDGSLALTGRGGLHIWSPAGEPVMTIDLPPDSRYASVAFADTRVFLGYGADLWGIDLVSRTVRKATLGAELTPDASTRCFWRTGANELWVVDVLARKVLRYRAKS